jgi:hypothetical protein
MVVNTGREKTESRKRETGSKSKQLGALKGLIRTQEFQEVAQAILSRYQDDLEENTLERLERIVQEKPRFGYWTMSETEYDLAYSLAMELGRIQVFKGSVSEDRDQYDLVRRLSRSYPTLVGLNLFDYRRQFVVILSPKARAMRRFALVEMAAQAGREVSIFFRQ